MSAITSRAQEEHLSAVPTPHTMNRCDSTFRPWVAQNSIAPARSWDTSPTTFRSIEGSVIQHRAFMLSVRPASPRSQPDRPGLSKLRRFWATSNRLACSAPDPIALLSRTELGRNLELLESVHDQIDRA